MIDLDARIKAMTDALDNIAMGSFDRSSEIAAGNDKLGDLERGINQLMMDMQTQDYANKERESYLLQQQKDLEERYELIGEQQKTLDEQRKEIEAKIEIIERQNAAIQELSTPILEIWDAVLVLPVIGMIDSRRTLMIKRTLLKEIRQTRAKCVILDVTGVEVVDTMTADHLLKIVRSAHLMGARCVMTGLSDSVAETIVEIGADLSEVKTLQSLQDGLRDCIRYLKSLREV